MISSGIIDLTKSISTLGSSQRWFNVKTSPQYNLASLRLRAIEHASDKAISACFLRVSTVVCVQRASKSLCAKQTVAHLPIRDCTSHVVANRLEKLAYSSSSPVVAWIFASRHIEAFKAGFWHNISHCPFHSSGWESAL